MKYDFVLKVTKGEMKVDQINKWLTNHVKK